MSTIAEAKQAIYNRLASSPTFHPASADLFADWTLQSGDIVTVNSGEESYSVPVFGLNMRWNGSPKVTVQSSGSQTRPSLEQMAVQKFSGSASGGAMANGSSYRSYRSQVKTSQQLYWEMTDDNGILKSSISATESELRTEYQNADSGLGSRIDQNAKSISMSVGRVAYDSSKKRNVSQLPDISTADPSLFYYVTGTQKYYIVSDGEWKQVDVDVATNGAYYIKAGEIAIAINDAGDTEAHIDAKKVILGQSHLTADDLETWAKDPSQNKGVFAKFMTVKQLTATEVNTLFANASVLESATIKVGEINVKDIVATGDNIGYNMKITASYDSEGSATAEYPICLLDAKVENNQLKIDRFNYSKRQKETITFSRATSLSGAWSSTSQSGTSIATLTLTGSPDTSLTYEVVIGSGTYSATKTTLEVTTGGVATIDESVAKSVSVPVKINQLNGSGTQPTQVYTKNVTYSVASLLESKTGSDKVTTNGNVPLTEGMLGFSAVNVDVHPTLSGSWTGSVLTVTANPSASSGNGFDLGFSTYGTHKHDLEVTTGGTASKDSLVANSVSVPVKVQKLNGSGKQPTEVYTKDITYSVASLLESKTGSSKITTNGTYTPSNGKLGFSSVVVEVDSGGQVAYDDSYVVGQDTLHVIKPVSSGGSSYIPIALDIGTAPSSTSKTRTVSVKVDGETKSELSETLSDYKNGWNEGRKTGVFYRITSAGDFTKAGNLYAGNMYGVETTTADGNAAHDIKKYWRVMPNQAKEVECDGDMTVTPDPGYGGLSSVSITYVDSGGGGCSHTDRGTFSCNVSSSYGSYTVTLTRTYPNSGYSDLAYFRGKDGSTLTVYT